MAIQGDACFRNREQEPFYVSVSDISDPEILIKEILAAVKERGYKEEIFGVGLNSVVSSAGADNEPLLKQLLWMWSMRVRKAYALPTLALPEYI